MKKLTRRASSKYLVDHYPVLMLDWDYSKNIGRVKELISTGSSKFLVDWKCHICGYEWSQKAVNRVKHISGCKQCYTKADSFPLKYPILFKDWDIDANKDIDPQLLTSGSSKIIHWKCHKCGYKWIQPLYVRVKLKSTCKICQVEEDLFINTHPHLLEEWDYEKNIGINPGHLTKGSNKKVWWNCKKCGNSFQADIYRRAIVGSGCGACRKRFQTKVPLSITHPELVKEWDYEKNIKYDPCKLTYGSNFKVSWNCKKGHNYESPICDRVFGNGCPYCRGLKVDDSNSLFYSFPEIAKEYDEENNELSSKEISKGSMKIVLWKCEINHSFQASVINRTKKNGTKCPMCVGRSATEDNNFAVLYVDLLKEWDFEKNIGIDPSKLRPGSSRKFWWKCKEGHSWNSALNSRISNNSGCPYCRGLFTPIEKSIGFLKPSYFDEWHWEKNSKIDPYTISEGSDIKVWWKCRKDENHIWKTAVGHRGGVNKTGCPYCASTIIILNKYLKNKLVKETDEILFYKLIFFNQTECFLKIGITKNTIAIRYDSLKYDTDYKILIIETILGNIRTIIDLEQTTHKRNSRNIDDSLSRYLPKKYFGGRSECYELTNDLEYLRALLTENYSSYENLIEIDAIHPKTQNDLS